MSKNIVLDLKILPPVRRKIFILYRQGFTALQISAKTGVQRTNVYAEIKRAIDTLYEFYYNKDKWRKLVIGAGLKKKEKMVFTRWKVWGMDTAEIAEDMGLRPTQIRIYIRRIKGKLKIDDSRKLSDIDPTDSYSDISKFDLNLEIAPSEIKEVDRV